MKTCRFCMHEQESGEYCEACGSPFSADKLDFSSGSMPDPTAGAFPDPTKSAFPKDPEIPAAPAPSNEPVPNVMPVAAVGMPSSGTPASEDLKPEVPSSEVPSSVKEEKKPEKKDNSGKKQPEKKQPEKKLPEKKVFPEEPTKIMYSASQNHETVYLKGKGNHLKKGPVDPKAFSPSLAEPEDAPTEQQGAGWWNGAAPSATPAPSQTSSATNAAAVPPWLNAFAIIMIVMSALGMVCLCGAGFVPLMIALIALNKITSVKNGSSVNVDRDLSTARILLIASALVLVLAAIIMLILV